MQNNRNSLMIKLLVSAMSLLNLTLSATDLNQVRQAGLHVVEITTIDGEEPQGQIITKPDNPNNHNMTYLNKVPCRVVITLGEETLYDSGPYQKKASGATIRINGNTTAYYSNPLNMPYNLKLEKAADLLCRNNDDKFKDKNWRLLKDAVSLNTIVGLKLSQIMEIEWTSAYVPCNVIINGDYRGCYLLMENVKRNELCRINCDSESGYIVEKDPYWWKENLYFNSLWYTDESIYRWTWKYPDEDDVTEAQETYIKQYIENMEQSLSEGNYEQFIDITSFAKWLLSHDILGTRDAGGSNMYIKKFDETNNSRLELPCLWDFDSSYEVAPGSFSRLHTLSNEYFYALMNSSNRAFATAYVTLWNKEKERIVSQLTDFINAYAISDEAKALEVSRKLYNERFGYMYGSVSNDIKSTLQWLEKHIEALDNQIQLIEISSTGIEQPITNNKKYKEQKFYRIDGVEIDRPVKHGITIYRNSNGKSIKISN